MKYSQTDDFAIELRGVADADEIRLEAQDHGAGFNLEEAVRDRGLGLVSKQERGNLVHGRFSIESGLGTGTKIIAIVP
jgi:signal transduction histidine kinase